MSSFTSITPLMQTQLDLLAIVCCAHFFRFQPKIQEIGGEIHPLGFSYELASHQDLTDSKLLELWQLAFSELGKRSKEIDSTEILGLNYKEYCRHHKLFLKNKWLREEDFTSEETFIVGRIEDTLELLPYHIYPQSEPIYPTLLAVEDLGEVPKENGLRRFRLIGRTFLSAHASSQYLKRAKKGVDFKQGPLIQGVLPLSEELYLLDPLAIKSLDQMKQSWKELLEKFSGQLISSRGNGAFCWKKVFEKLRANSSESLPSFLGRWKREVLENKLALGMLDPMDYEYDELLLLEGSESKENPWIRALQFIHELAMISGFRELRLTLSPGLVSKKRGFPLQEIKEWSEEKRLLTLSEQDCLLELSPDEHFPLILEVSDRFGHWWPLSRLSDWQEGQLKGVCASSITSLERWTSLREWL